MFSVFAGFVPAGEATIKSIAFALASASSSTPSSCAWCSCPAALSLLGERAWWLPTWLGWLPVLDVEGEGLRAPGGHGTASPVPVGADGR
jgi:RND superfamily putative drug exporter